MRIYPKYVSNAKLARRAAKGLPQREVPADGIERKWMPDGHLRERCLTPEAKQARREELYAR